MSHTNPTKSLPTMTQKTKDWATRTPQKVYQPWHRKLKIEPHGKQKILLQVFFSTGANCCHVNHRNEDKRSYINSNPLLNHIYFMIDYRNLRNLAFWIWIFIWSIFSTCLYLGTDHLTWKVSFLKFEKSPYCFEILFN